MAAEAGYDLTTGNIKKTVVRFALPYLAATFLQMFYGLVDLFVVGLYDPATTSNAVSIGAQVMHFLTVMIVGFALGATVGIGQCVGEKDYKRASKMTGTTICIFALIAAVLMTVLLVFVDGVTALMLTPAEAVSETTEYLTVCFAGLPLIIAFNVIAGICRGYGDSKSPLFFVGIACAVNIGLDFLFIGAMDMGAFGAALGTVCGQGVSVVTALIYIGVRKLGYLKTHRDIRLFRNELSVITKVGFPIFAQEALIQLAFVLIMIIANSRGMVDSVSVGVVEKFLGFTFLVPNSFLSAISAITAQNYGAGRPERAREALRFAILINLIWAVAVCVLCELFPGAVIGVFRREPEIIAAGTAYLRSYIIDIIFACVHFCFSGYFNGSSHSGITFLHNILSALIIRIPGAYILSMMYPESLFPMGCASPAGSAFSVVICLFFYYRLRKKEENSGPGGMRPVGEA